MSYDVQINSVQTLSLALQQSRMAAGITQRALAAQLGVSQRYIYELESGRDSKIVTRILAALAATGAVMTVAVPEGEPAPARATPEYTPRQIEERAAAAKQNAEASRNAREQGLFGHNDYNSGPSRPVG